MENNKNFSTLIFVMEAKMTPRRSKRVQERNKKARDKLQETRANEIITRKNFFGKTNTTMIVVMNMTSYNEMPFLRRLLTAERNILILSMYYLPVEYDTIF